MDGLIASALGMVFGVRRHHLDVGMYRESADMTENDEDRHTDEQLDPAAASFHPGNDSRGTVAKSTARLAQRPPRVVPSLNRKGAATHAAPRVS